MSNSLRCVVMRGGTSKAIFIAESELPTDLGERECVILGIFGSPDKRQIDGLGGADPLTSKLAIIAPADESTPGCDLVYTFGQVDILEPRVDWHSLCGNVTAAVGLYALEEGLVPLQEPVTRVRVHNTNLGRKLYVEVPVKAGQPVVAGTYTVPGVPGTGAKISIDFADTAGGATGKLLPTGNPVDTLTVDGIGSIEVSLVDLGNAHVFVRGADVGITGTETPSEIDATPGLRQKLEAIREAGAKAMGMVSSLGSAKDESPATPILAVISSPADYHDEFANRTIRAEEIDVVSRLQFMQQTHKTYAGTSTACTGAASRIPGTLVNQLARLSDSQTLRIGHPAGVIETETEVETVGGTLVVRRATLGRTARRIMEGTVFLPPHRAIGPETQN